MFDEELLSGFCFQKSYPHRYSQNLINNLFGLYFHEKSVCDIQTGFDHLAVDHRRGDATILSLAHFGPYDHREDASHFINTLIGPSLYFSAQIRF